MLKANKIHEGTKCLAGLSDKHKFINMFNDMTLIGRTCVKCGETISLSINNETNIKDDNADSSMLNWLFK